MQRLSLQVGTDYFQFYLLDPAHNCNIDETSEANLKRRLLVGRNKVLVHTVRPMSAPVEVEIHDHDPGYDLNAWDHIAECSVEVESGKLDIAGCTDGPVASLSMQPGSYRVRVHFGKLDSVDDTGLKGDDHYKIAIWPAPGGDTLVLKQWNGLTGGYSSS